MGLSASFMEIKPFQSSLGFAQRAAGVVYAGGAQSRQAIFAVLLAHRPAVSRITLKPILVGPGASICGPSQPAVLELFIPTLTARPTGVPYRAKPSSSQPSGAIGSFSELRPYTCQIEASVDILKIGDPN